MKSCAEEKPNRYDLLVAAAVILLALLLGAKYRPTAAQNGAALTVVVEIDGAEADHFALDAAEVRTYRSNGYTLTLMPDATGGIRVSHSDCPTQDCVRTGTVSRAGQSIVCLPARVVVTLVGEQTEYDVIAG